MKYVLDSSVALKWFLTENDSIKARRLPDEWRQNLHELIAPDFFPIEMVHALTRAERQGRITEAEGAAFVGDLLSELPRLHPSLPLILRGYTISSALRIGAYDCLYVALAEREGCPFITADTKLVGSLHKYFPFIVSLASLP